MDKPTIKTAIIGLLRERGPMSAGDLGSALKAAGVTKAKNPTAAANNVLDYGPFVADPDGRWSYLVDLLDGLVLTKRVSEQERRSGVLRLDVDVAPLARFPLSLADGRPLPFRWANGRTLTGPDGWLDVAAPDALTSFRLANDVLEVAAVDSAAVSDGRMIARRVAAQVETAYGEPGRPLPGVPIAFAVCQLRLASADVLREPTLPLSELLVAQGLEVHDDLVGVPGTDWSGWDELYDDDTDDDDDDEFGLEVDLLDPDAVDDIARAFDFDARSRASFDEIVIGSRNTTPLSPAQAARAAVAFADPDVAAALAANGDDEVMWYAAAVADVSTAAAGAGARFVEAALVEAAGEDVAAESILAASLVGDPTFVPGLLMAARYADDRGDAQVAVELLRRAGVAYDDPQLSRLRRFAEPPPGGPSRNAPCPCGSGRKYKMCCLSKATHPLADRSRWLFAKVAQWVNEPGQRLDLLPYAFRIYGESIEAISESLSEGIVHGLALFEGGLLEEFLTRRGELLPPDEVALAASWLASDVRCYDVVDVRAGIGMTLRDVRDESEHTVADRASSSQLKAGDTLCARLLATGGGSEMFAFVFGVAPSQLGGLLRALESDRGSGTAIAEYVGAMRRPPTITTSEGEEFVLRTATYRLPDPAAALAALGKELTDQGDGMFTYDGERGLVRAFVRVDGDQLTVETNSAERFTRLERIVRAAAPGVVRLSSERRTLADIAADPDAPQPNGALDEQPPEVREALEEYLREMERRWVDEQVPALGGATPRQAAADATLRPRLLALLEDFELAGARAAPGSTYDVARLRTLLGL